MCVRVSSLIAAPLSFQNLPVSDMRSALTCALVCFVSLGITNPILSVLQYLNKKGVVLI